MKKTRLIYCGITDHGAKAVYCFRDPDNLGKTRVFVKTRRIASSMRSAIIGEIYELEETEPGSFAFPTRMSDAFVDNHPDQTEIATWEVESYAAQKALDAERLNARRHIDNKIWPLTRIRAELNPRDQAAFDAYLLRSVRGIQ